MNSSVSQNSVVALQNYSREELEQRVQELTDFVENASLPLHWVDENGIIVWANQAELDLLGYTADEYIGHSIVSFHADKTIIEDILTRLINNETLHNYPAKLRCKDGAVKHVLINSNVFRRDSKFIHTRCFTRDITLIKQGEEKSARLAAIVESSADAIISKTLDGVITSWNKSAERMFGYAEHEILGQLITVLIPNERLHEEQMIIEKVRNGDKVEHLETYRLTKNKVSIPVSLTISPIKDTAGAVIGASQIARDITRQKSYEERLQGYADTLETLNTIGKQISELIDADEIVKAVIDVTVLVTKADFGALFYGKAGRRRNPVAGVQLTGANKSFEDFYQKHEASFYDLIVNHEFGEILSLTDESQNTDLPDVFRLMKEQLPFSAYLIVPIISKTGAVTGMIFYGFTNRDRLITGYENLLAGVAGQVGIALEKAELYEEIHLLNTKKDEFIGLASHELKTPVTSLQGYLQILYKSLPVDERNRDLVDRALKQTGKLTRLIADLLDVSKIESGQLPLSLSDFDLIPFLSELIDLMQYTTKTHHIALHTDLKEVIISADRNRVEQVITNLVSNAIKYSPKSDLVKVSVSTDGAKVIVAIEDFGIGIKKEQQECIFSRFYRVEELAGYMSGLGLGLYISREIIARHGGHLYLESEPGKGSVFTFELPVFGRTI